MQHPSGRNHAPFRHPTRSLKALLGATLALGMSVPAWASDFIVYSPHVTQGRSELEFRGAGFHDSNPSRNGARSGSLSAAYGVTAWWKPELYFAQYTRQADGTVQRGGYEFENTFQLAAEGEYWADPGFVLAYEHVSAPGMPNVMEFGPLFEKRLGRVDQRLNLIWEKQIGRGASGQYAFRSAYSIGYRVRATFEPGLEAYYRPSDNASHLGPVVSGELRTGAGREIDYSVGVVFGLNPAAPDQTVVARVEYEF